MSAICWSDSPPVAAVTLFFVIVHLVTWFDLTPKAMVVRVGGKRVRGIWLVVSNYIAWIVVSTLVGWLILKG